MAALLAPLIHSVRLLVSVRLILLANSVFLSQETNTSQPKLAPVPTSEHADCHRRAMPREPRTPPLPLFPINFCSTPAPALPLARPIVPSYRPLHAGSNAPTDFVAMVVPKDQI